MRRFSLTIVAALIVLTTLGCASDSPVHTSAAVTDAGSPSPALTAAAVTPAGSQATAAPSAAAATAENRTAGRTISAAQAGPGCQEITYPSTGATVRATYCEPAGGERNLPAVVVLPGCGGPPEFSEVAPAFAGEGFVALYIDYFTQTPPPGGKYCQAGGVPQRLAAPTWLQNIADGVTYLQGQPRVAPNRIGIFGYSLGAAVAARSASQDQRYRAVIFLSGVLIEFLRPNPAAMPPTYIFHGDVDDAANVSQAYALRDMLAAAGRPHEIRIYPGNGHGWPAPAWPDAYTRMVAFLRTQLAP